MSIKKLSQNDGIAYVKSLVDIAEARLIADELEITYSGNTGLPLLQEKIVSALNEPEPEVEDTVATVVIPEDDAEDELEIQIAPAPTGPKKLSNKELLELNANEIVDPIVRRQVIRAKSLRLSRVRIQNLDPSEASIPGAILTVSNKYIGKVSRYIPNSNEGEGYHVEEIILKMLHAKKFVLRKEVGISKFGIKKYRDVLVAKYSIEILPPMTQDELDALGRQQVASGSLEDQTQHILTVKENSITDVVEFFVLIKDLISWLL